MSKRRPTRIRLRDPADDEGNRARDADDALRERRIQAGSVNGGSGNRYGGVGGLRSGLLPGNNGFGGRPVGSQNRVTVVLKQAIMFAAEDVGEDGEGKDGVRGYMRRLAVNEPAVFGQLLRRIMPVQVKADLDPQSTLAQVLEAARAKLAFERAKVIDTKPRSTWTRD